MTAVVVEPPPAEPKQKFLFFYTEDGSSYTCWVLHAPTLKEAMESVKKISFDRGFLVWENHGTWL